MQMHEALMNMKDLLLGSNDLLTIELLSVRPLLLAPISMI